MDDTEEATKVSTMGDNINTVSRRKKKSRRLTLSLP